MDHSDFIVCGVMEKSIDLKSFFQRQIFSRQGIIFMRYVCVKIHISLAFLHYVNIKGGVKTHFNKVLKSEYPTNYGTKCQ